MPSLGYSRNKRPIILEVSSDTNHITYSHFAKDENIQLRSFFLQYYFNRDGWHFWRRNPSALKKYYNHLRNITPLLSWSLAQMLSDYPDDDLMNFPADKTASLY